LLSSSNTRKSREILSGWHWLRARCHPGKMVAMRRSLLVVAVCVGACGAPQGTTAVSRGFSHETQLRKATVYIRECGTGWLASEKYVVTNAHVVACLLQRNHQYATVDFSDGTTMKAWFAAMSSEPYVDLAILALDGQVDYQTLDLAITTSIPKDTLLLSVGNPSPVTWVPTTYRVVMQPEHVEGGLSRVLILEGLAMHGNSGSPVVGMDGKVVGTIFARAPGFAYAVPVQPYLVTLLRTVSPKRTWP
jgi:S1-C subfamily serine protease